jgi:hypothetical protein
LYWYLKQNKGRGFFMNSKKTIIIIAAILVLLIVAFVIIYTQVIAKPVEGAKALTIEIIGADETATTKQINTDEEFLRGALEQEGLIEGLESEYGLFVLTVDGYTADDANEEWWSFTKDGEMLMTGVDDTPIMDGDKFEITLTVGY